MRCLEPRSDELKQAPRVFVSTNKNLGRSAEKQTETHGAKHTANKIRVAKRFMPSSLVVAPDLQFESR